MALPRFFQRYTGWLRSLKAVYVINNVLNFSKLARNKPLYRKYGLHKSLVAPIGSGDFQQHHPDIPWIDQPDALQRVTASPEFNSFPPAVQEQIRKFIAEGYLVLEGFFSDAEVDAMNSEVDAKLAGGQVDYNYTGRKIFNLFETSRLANDRFFQNPDILRLLGFLLGKKVIPFQSMNFTQGSEQRAHSDFIHMTTEPLGYLIATWTALEDCTPENGPLFYYPGSHRLPYITTQDYPSGNTLLTIGGESNRRYEDKIAAVIAEHNLQKTYFLGKKGDVLVWHANLLHGGSPILRPGATRKSFVCHYFAEDVICYHEISQRPALIGGQPN